MWNKIVTFLLLLYIIYLIKKPKPISSLKVSYVKGSDIMNHAHVTAKWTASVTPGVVSQHLTVKIGDVVTELDVAPDVATHEFDAPEKTHVEVTVTAFDGTLFSAPVSATLDIPALNPPASVTDLALSFVSAEDAPVV